MSQLSDEARVAAGAMLSAAAAGHVAAFRAAAAKLPGQAPGCREPAHQRNALHIAAMSGRSEICTVALKEFQFPPDEPDKEGECLKRCGLTGSAGWPTCRDR
jgi:ankyrin repeat protein